VSTISDQVHVHVAVKGHDHDEAPVDAERLSVGSSPQAIYKPSMSEGSSRPRFTIEAIGFVRGARQTLEDDAWGGTESVIELADGIDAEALLGLDAFSHAEVFYIFDRVPEVEIAWRARRPRGNEQWPRVGIFAQRGKGRPNRLGATVVAVKRIEGSRIVVAELDAVEGTPVVDIKPVMKEFLPRGEVRQPAWATELMRQYWR
jgi:tRNA-Thr(GGU) m(6)t(6)A37 methyltransferase TsaA